MATNKTHYVEQRENGYEGVPGPSPLGTGETPDLS